MPTPDQTLAYARFVTTAHSWHKRLFFPDIALVFFLDPAAGAVVNKDSGWMQTTDYRTRFGHWNYMQGGGERASLPDVVQQAGTACANAFMFGPDFDERLRTAAGPMIDAERIRHSPLSVPEPGAAFAWPGRPQGDPLLAMPPGVADALRPLLAMWRHPASRDDRREAPLLKALAIELDAERARQIENLVAAMNRFAAALRAA